MKYIRTKEGIYENLSTNAYIRDVGVAKVIIKHIDEETLEESFEFRMCKLEDILKQADNIEELCDEFVLFDDKSSYTIYTSYEEAQRIRKNRIVYYDDKHNMIIYGAIWTHKGLIYVAELNEKGELKLL